MFIQSDPKRKLREWQDYTLIMPAVSVGNVGQLAVDLLISTLWMERVGHIHHESILPLVGNDPFAHEDFNDCKLVTSCDVYESIEHKVVVIQQRAPFVRGKMALFRKWLKEWIINKSFKKLVILTSSRSEERLDIQIQGDQLRFLASQCMEETKTCQMLRSAPLNWLDLERRNTPEELQNGSEKPNYIYVPGGGIAKSLLEECGKDMPVVVLLMFCSEGDNSQDAIFLASRLNQWLDLVDMKPKKREDGQIIKPLPGWKIPLSWRHLFGARVDQTLFH
ncbi:proteasome assembly chaperone 2-like [Mizuhopecten yessoensis]|uniref:Proteasome assembly chaperone 2 n=1 Tax=Mizuhopecten yessoensis TaxID=6573 RepID=A0A210QGZ3_MIZYE|nr:proteasome assembly chaperone 2-like [Mizuhopecten yessoensis]OWF48025.1 Proteasome assembly chaperone 2 [Mizuhopecten yessoensis]